MTESKYDWQKVEILVLGNELLLYAGVTSAPKSTTHSATPLLLLHLSEQQSKSQPPEQLPDADCATRDGDGPMKATEHGASKQHS